MKKLTLSMVSVLLLGGVSLNADSSDKAFYEPSESGVYVGLGYGYYNHNCSNINFATNPSIGLDAKTMMLQGGYKYNPYLSFEARYWYGFGDIHQYGGEAPGSYSGDVNTWGIYLKPTIPVEKGFDLYALVGYGSTSVEIDKDKWDVDNFSWGFGLQLEVMENLSVFGDYVSNASADSFSYTYTSGTNVSDIDAYINVYTFNFGVNYRFAL